MAKKNYFHQYLVDNDFWSAFDPNRISGSTSTCGILHSLTSPLKQIRSFVFSICLLHIHNSNMTNPNNKSDHETIRLLIEKFGFHVCLFYKSNKSE